MNMKFVQLINLKLLLTCIFFLAKHNWDENVSANKYENANYYANYC